MPKQRRPIHTRINRAKLREASLWVAESRYALLAGCLLLAALFVLGPRLYGLIYGYIDPSFNYALNEAAVAKKAFGTEFIATYGPLSYLVTNYLPQNLLKESIGLAVYAIGLGTGVFLFVSLYCKHTYRRWLYALLLLYALTVTNGGGSIEWGYLTAFLLYGFILLKVSPRWQLPLASVLAVVAAIFSLTKFTLGFASIAALGFIVVFSTGHGITEKVKRAAIVAVAYLVPFLLLGHYLGIVSFWSYVRTAFIEGQGFNTAMVQYDQHTVVATLLTALALALLIVWPVLHGKRELLRYAFLLPAAYTIWKYAVVRQDGHILRLLQVTIPLAVIIYLSWEMKIRYDRTILVAVLVASSFAMWADNMPFAGPNGFGSAISAPVANIINHNPLKYFEFRSQKTAWGADSALGLRGAKLPAMMRSAIGDKTVDIFPWETSVVAANDLRWDNRPSPFSFESYNPYLDNLNARFFGSDDAPEFVVWHNTQLMSIDGRHVAWDEPATLRSLLVHYKYVSADDAFMLLEKRADPVALEVAYQNLGTVTPSNSWIRLESSEDQLLFVSFTVKRSIKGKLKAGVLRGNVYYLSLKSGDGKVNTYRLLTENTSNGILVNDLPTTWSSLQALFTDGKSNTPDGNVKEVRLTVSSHS